MPTNIDEENGNYPVDDSLTDIVEEFITNKAKEFEAAWKGYYQFSEPVVSMDAAQREQIKKLALVIYCDLLDDLKPLNDKFDDTIQKSSNEAYQDGKKDAVEKMRNMLDEL